MALLAAAHLRGAVDTGWGANEAAFEFGQNKQFHGAPCWMRLRGVPEGDASTAARVAAQGALENLRRAGHKTVILLRWEARSWPSGTRAGGHLPTDLRLAYERCRALAVAYRDAVDAWEIENEPDLGFVPEGAEHYAAFLKACYLGFKAGSPTRNHSESRTLVLETSTLRCEPLVVMAPMGAPPGTWFERFVANEGLSYTEAFNFHYYGYDEDFTGVYRMFEDAVRAANQSSGPKQLVSSNERLTSSAQELSLAEKRLAARLPIFATEIGYGMLGMRERDTKEARLRQWRWFQSVGDQATRLGIEAPMAFYLQRYHEPTGLEFGLIVPRTSPKAFNLYARGGRYAGDNYFTPADFGAAMSEEWMRGIGQRIAGGEATPALAWWLARYSPNRPKREWTLSTAAPSPIVIDLIAHGDVYGEHRYNGYFVRGIGAQVTGKVDLVLYNFSDHGIKGTLRLPSHLEASETGVIELAPMERRVVPATVKINPRYFVPEETTVEFSSTSVPLARFATQFYPQFDGRSIDKESSLTLARVAQSPFAGLEKERLLAREEAPKHLDNSCWVQTGASVNWTLNGFSVTITARPAHKERRVEVEIPWPADFEFTAEHLLRLEYRATKLQPRGNEWPSNDELMILVRTANGNLYAGAPMRNVRETWNTFWEPPQNFTLWFYGRANVPWAFGKNRPVSLVLAFYPVSLPVTYEFRRVALISLSPLTVR